MNMRERRSKVEQHERAVSAFLGVGGAGFPPGMSGGGGSTGFSLQKRRAKGLEVRVPDPRNWALDMLQNGDKDWYAWRKSFDIQVRSVWGDLDKLLVEMRDHDEPMDEAKYDELLKKINVIPEGGKPLDYGYKHVSNKLCMVLHMYAGDDAHKVIEESCDRCGSRRTDC